MEFLKKNSLRLPAHDMSKSRERSEFVRSLKPGSRVHLSGICGTGMAAVASLLKQLGFSVSGSDKAFWPPMGDFVRSLADYLFEGYCAENLDSAPELVVIGNNLSRDNPEVKRVLEQDMAYASMPEVLSALLIGTRGECQCSVVAAGTHGKTTTSAAIAVLLDCGDLHPGYFIGGMPVNFEGNIRPVDKTLPLSKRAVVLEGDEYDSAFFAKWAKFHSYRPDIAVISSLEFDHADIYRSIEDIEAEFNRLVVEMPETGLVLVCGDYENLRKLGKSWNSSPQVKARVCLYGESEESDYRLLGRVPNQEGGQSLVLLLEGGKELRAETSLNGKHNALNLLSAAAVGHKLGLSDAQLRAGIAEFRGVMRRQQLIFNECGIRVIEDFAHHPTEVSCTLEGLRESYPKSRLIAVYEPRSNTSRRAFFQQDYKESFFAADVTILRQVSDAGTYSGTGEPIVSLDVEKLVQDLKEQGSDAESFSSVPEIKDFLVSALQPGDVAVLMSNGDFDGLAKELIQSMKA